MDGSSCHKAFILIFTLEIQYDVLHFVQLRKGCWAIITI